MTERLKQFLQGVGSVMNIAPAPDPRRYLPSGSDQQRLRGDLEKIGADMSRACVFSHNTGGQRHASP